MIIREHSKAAVRCFMACVVASLIFSMSNQAQAQVTYTVTGFANNFNIGGIASGTPDVGANESFTAVFEIDDSIVDNDPSLEAGLYSGAIISSSITFAGGHTSTVDFSGGDVTIVTTENGGGGVFLNAPGDNGSFTLFTLTPFDSDALLTDEQEFSELPGSLWSLEEPNGLVTGFTPGDPENEFETMALSVSQSVMLGDCNLDGVLDFLDLPPFIAVLTTGEFLAQADIDQSGNVTFLDIPPFIAMLSNNPPAN